MELDVPAEEHHKTSDQQTKEFNLQKASMRKVHLDSTCSQTVTSIRQLHQGLACEAALGGASKATHGWQLLCKCVGKLHLDCLEEALY